MHEGLEEAVGGVAVKEGGSAGKVQRQDGGEGGGATSNTGWMWGAEEWRCPPLRG